jgi:membrane dipeptidase
MSRSFIVDAHSDFVNRVVEARRSGKSDALVSEYLPALREGGVRFVAMQVGSDFAGQTEQQAVAESFEKISVLKAEVAASEQIRLVTSDADFNVWQRGDGVGILMALEGGKAFGQDVSFVATYHELGVRMAALTWNDCNRIACGSGCQDDPTGLTDFGVEIVQEMGRLGMILDVSHLSDAGVAHALQVATGPVVATHSNARSLCDHVRNLTDEQIRAIADGGGVIGVNFFPRFLDKQLRPGPAEIVAQIKHLIALAGEDAVGFGPDFIDYSRGTVEAALLNSSVDYGTDFDFPIGLESTKDLSKLPRIRADAGIPEAQAEKILNGNWLRVFRSALG